MSNELTYILGAGASFQSIPLVSTFASRMTKFKDRVIDYSDKMYNQESSRPLFKVTIDEINNLIEDFKSHQSFDTYFKKHFHLGNDKKINQGKRILNLYFLWEHSDESLYRNFDLGKGDFYKQSLYDKRYDALIAGLLQPKRGYSEPITKVNFLTWNYDINLLVSLKNFFYPNLTFKEMFKEIEFNGFSWKIKEHINVININGNFFSSTLNDIRELKLLDFEKILDGKIRQGYSLETGVDADADGIKFGWEREDKDAQSLNESLKKIIRMSDNIIVIGYSFPVYNRFIDLDYLEQDSLVTKNITIQDPNADVIKQNILDVYRVKDKGNIRTISNCDSFYLPSSVFGVNEYKAPHINSTKFF